MNITISENIKKLRKEKNITQAELASEFGVTCQSVCRWENGAAYPDIELIPKIAAYFGITTDRLLGCDEESVESRINKIFKLDIFDKETDIKEKIAVMRKVMTDLPYEPQIKYHILRQYHILGKEECAKNIIELREFAEFICASDADFWIKHNTRVTMTDIEPDEVLCKPWLEQLGNDFITPDEALLERYAYRDEIDKYNIKAQENLVTSFLKLIAKGFKHRGDYTYHKRAAVTSLQMIDTLRDCDTDTDAWMKVRARVKFRLANACFKLGQLDEGFSALEEGIELLVKIAELPTSSTVGYNTPLLNDIVRDKKYLYSSIEDMVEQILIEPDGYWEGMKNVSDCERYKSVIERITKLIN